ncbi:histidine phosphatase family protein [Nocardioides seonyuensis]|uniref:histidine phosphatase family protein n=1 Tax=Nocardioides seonyuensis TaxID=2518371 RepID=UPI001420298C|nr:histidine phosphatase family protein [Nocardioides seonyuensis]
MSHRTLVLLRHGQTAWNAERRGQGHHDVHLDETGVAQAAAVASVLARLHPRLVWSSDLSRARATASRVAEASGVSLRTDPRLREFDLGERTGLTMPEFAQAFPEGYLAFLQGRYDAVPGAESTEQVSARFTAALREAQATLEPGECGVVVGHGAALKVAVAALLGWPSDAVATFAGMDNCGWTVLDDGGPDGAARLVAWNRTITTAPDFASAATVG